MRIEIKKLNPNAVIPANAHPGDAGYDLCACTSDIVYIKPGETVMIPTGLAIAVPHGYFGGIFARSGLASKEGLRPANCVGVADCNYRGEYKVALYNDSCETRAVLPGQKIAQLVVMPCADIAFEEVTELSDTERGEGGFGSSGM